MAIYTLIRDLRLDMNLLQKTNNMNLQYLSDNKGLGDEDIDDIRAYDAAKAQDGEVIPFDQAVKDIEEGT